MRGDIYDGFGDLDLPKPIPKDQQREPVILGQLIQPYRSNIVYSDGTSWGTVEPVLNNHFSFLTPSYDPTKPEKPWYGTVDLDDGNALRLQHDRGQHEPLQVGILYLKSNMRLQGLKLPTDVDV